jgi:hypothetical protein
MSATAATVPAHSRPMAAIGNLSSVVLADAGFIPVPPRMD